MVIYKINHDNPSSQEFIGPIRNLNYCILGNVRKHKTNGYYYIYTILPKREEDQEDELIWMRFDLMYKNYDEIQKGCKMNDHSFEADLEDLGQPLSKEAIEIVWRSINNAKKDSRITII